MFFSYVEKTQFKQALLEVSPSIENERIENLFDKLGGKNFLLSSPAERAAIIRDYLSSKENEYPVPETPEHIPADMGMLVIKPETQPIKEQILDLVEERGIEITSTHDTHYSLDSFLGIYQDHFKQADESAGLSFPSLLFSGATEKITVIFFKFKKTEQNGHTTDDPHRDFKENVIGTGENPEGSTIRAKIQPALRQLGFGLIDSLLAKKFDITGELRKRSAQENLRTFNGIHCPASTLSCHRQIRIFLHEFSK